MELNKIYNEECVQGMKNRIDDQSIDLILCDLPYGQTARNKWDSVIPFDDLWKEYKRIIKPNGIICLFGNGLFTADMMLSNREMWKYNLVWNKIIPSGFLNSKKMPLRSHEDIVVFYKKSSKYNPQMIKGNPAHGKGKNVGKSQEDFSRNSNYGKLKAVVTEGDMKYPKSILEISKPHPSLTIHPTQKPTQVMEWLIKTYTNEGDVVLDNCMGSGTTAVACVHTNRNYIGFEMDTEQGYYTNSLYRINGAVEGRDDMEVCKEIKKMKKELKKENT